MVDFSTSWIIISLMSLAWLTYEDITNKKRLQGSFHTVDDRKNYYMYGITTALFFLSPLTLWPKLGILFLSFVVVNFIKKSKYFGDGDTNSFAWMINGWMLLGFGVPFLAIFSLVVGMFVFFSNRLFMRNVPFFLFIFFMQVTTSIVYFGSL